MKRRDFLVGSFGLGLVGNADQSDSTLGAKEAIPRIREYRILGRTGFKASDIGCGSGALGDESVLKILLDRGVNYIDTGEAYVGGRSETIIGNVIKGINRKSVFIATKLMLRPNEKREEIERRALKCLERLQTDHADCLMIHMAVSRQDVKNEEFHKAVKKLKNDGKLRYAGVSCHGADWAVDAKVSMEDVLGAAIEDGRFDVLLLAYNFIQREMAERLLKACHDKGIGTTLMKTEPFGSGLLSDFKEMYAKLEKEGKAIPARVKKLVENQEELQKSAAPFFEKHRVNTPGDIRDASIRFVLDNRHVNSVLVTFRNFDQIENYLRLSGNRLSKADKDTLRAFSDTYGRLYCRHACGLCESACPAGVPVNTIMRYNHYFSGQGREKDAMQKYAELRGADAGSCNGCEGFCQTACPYDVPIHGLLNIAHSNLSLA